MASTERDSRGFRTLTGLEERDLRDVLTLVTGSDLLEMELSVNGTLIALRREPAALSGENWSPSEAPDLPVTSDEAERDPRMAISSPLVGLFHPAVNVGDAVQEGQSLGRVEAMGMPTGVDAPRAGIVDELLVLDGGPVEFGQPLLVLRPGGSE